MEDEIKRLKKRLKQCNENLDLFNDWSAWSYEKNKQIGIKDKIAKSQNGFTNKKDIS